MGSLEQLCLRWNDFESSIKKGFSQLRAKNEFFDVTLASRGRFLKAHKVILSACSPFFHDIISNIPHDHPFIYLRDIKPQHLESILSFMYNGEVNVEQEDLENFLSVAEELQINGLSRGLPRDIRRGQSGLKRPSEERLPVPPPPSAKVKKESNEPFVVVEEILEDDEDEEEYIAEEENDAKRGEKDLPSFGTPEEILSSTGETMIQSNQNELDLAIDKLICRSPSGHIYCSQCDYSTALQRSIRDHIEAKHIVTDGFECEHCSLRCKTRASLRRHTYRRHPRGGTHNAS